jgi:hypothetical protein
MAFRVFCPLLLLRALPVGGSTVKGSGHEPKGVASSNVCVGRLLLVPLPHPGPAGQLGQCMCTPLGMPVALALCPQGVSGPA